MDFPKVQRNRQALGNTRPRRGRWLGYLLTVIARPSRRHRPPITPVDLKRHDHAVSTQRLGMRFTERIRDTFRHRWLRKLL